MRQGQSHQNKNRSRGRGGSRNKGGNQSNRSMESNGPDVRIRGTAAHIAEKYTTMARDVQTASSGDLVAAENYLQHAEHYNRLIAAAQAAQAAQAPAPVRDNNRNDDQRRQPIEQENIRSGTKATDERLEDENVSAIEGDGPQPIIDGLPAEVALKQPVPNGEGEVAEEKPEPVRRRTRRAPRRPRKETVSTEVAANTDTTNEQQPELPAFIVGANER